MAMMSEATAKRIRELMNVSGLKRESIGSHLQPSSLGRLDIQASTPSGQFSPQILAALQAKFLDHPLSDLVTAMEQPALIQSSLQEPKCIIAENEFGVWAPGSNIGCVNPQNSNMPIDILHQQQHQQQ
ncbi:Two-component response regulator [Melia azedarach]|uniref:Two-component response regulator n=1 Tax=Melia azedarach TaxID=155640 RepID=A0ACC1XWS4_MELAZ|nr:Two-component response regulator [Melia azedarach]